LPVSKEAYAVAAEEYLVEMLFELRHGEVLVDDLRDLEGWDEIEGGLGDDADVAEGHDCS